MSEQRLLWKRTPTEVVALVTDADTDVLVGRPIAKRRALAALAAPVELAERTRRRRRPAIRAARAAGATWTEIDPARRDRPGNACLEYQRVLAELLRLGLVPADRSKPGVPKGRRR